MASMPPDPYTSTRRDFTQYILSQNCPVDADNDVRQVFESQQKLLRLLIEHDAMKPNIDQTYMTPAASKNKIYFMWDFVGRTMGYLTAMNPASRVHPLWADVEGRTMMAKQLILDRTGKLNMMIPNPAPGTFEFGDDIEQVAREL